ncbi:sialidase family protein [Prolixibacter sp. SD074]|uniref:sialidase family protein n=1 Tax=Prolixibacter sp. SD074 TaxID=2652391 RepID=UPI0018903018|nr:sialidase family protein [Prolixibacter sp. SD074]
MNTYHFFLLLYVFFGLVVSCSNNSVGEVLQEPLTKPNIDGIRIDWDYSTMVKIAPAVGHNEVYCGYARLEQIHDGNLACVYETSSGNVELVFSYDSGKTWSTPQIVFRTENNISMAVPDIIELSDHSILVACNPRPRKAYTDDRKFGIKVKRSVDGGKSWGDEKLIYEAQSTFNDGCWEPSFVQLPSGEVQLYFSNEGIYTSSDEQNISIFRSMDSGKTWTKEPEIVGFRKNRRDGMPVPLVLQDKGEILVSVEDNKQGEFKPTIYHEKLSKNWADGVISGDDPRRDYQPLDELLPDEISAGAPFIVRLKSGEVLLSYQSTWNRSDSWDRACMVVEVGTDDGTRFRNRSVPFTVPINKSGLWNSLLVINDGTVPVALTSTNAYSTNSTEVWMIKGHVIPEFSVPVGTISVDGQLTEGCWQGEWPYFIGQKSKTRMKATVCADDHYLYLASKIDNLEQVNGSAGGISCQVDIARKGYEKPHHGIFTFHFNLDRSLKIEEGDYGTWKELDVPGSIQYKVRQKENSYVIEAAIPKAFFKNGLPQGNTVGINFLLNYNLLPGHITEESISGNDKNAPYTWCPILMN